MKIFQGSPFFQEIPPSVLGKMIRLFKERSFPPGSIILTENRRARRLFLLLQGTVVLSIRRREEELILEVVKKKGSLFGWSALVPPKTYTATAKALEEVRVLIADGTKLERFFQRYPSSGWRFLRRLSSIIATRLARAHSLLADTLS
jgi:CRP-like cAMP-binding protein